MAETPTVGVFTAAKINNSTVADMDEGTYNPNPLFLAPEQDGKATKQLITDLAPEASFRTTALDTFLALNSSKFFTRGVALDGTDGFEGFAPDSATDASKGTTGTKYKFTYGLLVPETLEAENDAAATLTVRAHGRSNDGSTAPVAITTAQTLPTFSAGNMFSLGRCEYNGSNITWAQRISINFGLEVRRMKGDGATYSSKLVVVGVRPSITLSVADTTLAATLTLLGTRVSSATHIHFRAWDAAGTRAATNATSHINLAIEGTNSLVMPVEVRTNVKDTALQDITYRPIWNGTNELVTVTTGVAYS